MYKGNPTLNSRGKKIKIRKKDFERTLAEKITAKKNELSNLQSELKNKPKKLQELKTFALRVQEEYEESDQNSINSEYTPKEARDKAWAEYYKCKNRFNELPKLIADLQTNRP